MNFLKRKKKEKSKEDLINFIKETIREYEPLLLLQRHTFEVKEGCENPRAIMDCVCNYPYLNATIRFSQMCYDEWVKGKDIVPWIVHEMCHVITDPLYVKATYRYLSKDELSDERENLTDLISHLILKIKKHGQSIL